jgi:hypothetical protein
MPSRIQPVHLAVGGDERHGRAAVHEPGQRLVNGGLRDPRIEPQRGLSEAVGEDHVALVRPPRAVVEVLRLGRMALQHVEAMQVLQALQQRLFDLILGDEVGHTA